ncbi:MAG: S8 family serine peptidase [Candidatus Aquilonibacter sp.]
MALLARFRALLAATLAVSLAACGGGGGGGSTPPVQPTATPTPVASSPYTCPSSDTSLDASGARASGSASSEVRRSYRGSTNVSTLPVLAVSYRTGAIANPASSIDGRVASFGATKYREFDYPATGVATRLLHVNPSSIAQVESTLRSTPGVVAVSQSRRSAPLAVTNPYLGNDPYFVGYTAGGAQPPLYQLSTTNGQWDMHIVQLEHAFGYSQNGNGSGITNVNALGSTSVKLAIIDTGEDVTHPELQKAHIVRTECFVSNEAGTAQSTGTFVTDGAGHGTDVTGIAVANAENDYGFVGDAGNVSLMLYRVFPTPDDNCTPGNPAGESDPQCGAQDTDVASAIGDAVANGANVISMSIGITISETNNNGCTSPGVDSDPVEGNAVANAIAHNVIVVAASGNAGGEGITAPACDSGVIAAGASGYEDGQTNGTNNGGSVGSEYVTSYTQYGTGSWGIVAPGGDPSTAETSPSATTVDYLHWIQNIWTTTPFDSNFAGACTASTEFGESGNCTTLIVGTSMATPHIAGAAALILSVSSTYQSPSAMFQLLCSTADNIGDAHQGCGRLNVYRAMAKALNDPNPPT